MRNDCDEGSNMIDKPTTNLADFDRQLNASEDNFFFSDDDFKRIKELQAKEKLSSINIPTRQLSLKPLDPAKFEPSSKRKLTEEQRVAIMKAGREDREPYKAKAALKKKKNAGTSNNKPMPRCVEILKISKRKEIRKKKQKTSKKQFRGKKAWKK